MNAQQMNDTLKAHSDRIRLLIREERETSRMTEQQVNDLYFNNMARRNLTAPKAIMTKVRDTRRDFILNHDEAECMAAALEIGAQLLMPPEAPQRELPIATNSKPPAHEPPDLTPVDTAPASPQPSVVTEQAPERRESDNDRKTATTVFHTPSPQQAAPTQPRRQESEGGRKISVGMYETDEGLRFIVNKILTPNQFDRLTLAIPEYMMQVERLANGFMTRANVPIFPYQAELLTRAIYGAK